MQLSHMTPCFVRLYKPDISRADSIFGCNYAVNTGIYADSTNDVLSDLRTSLLATSRLSAFRHLISDIISLRSQK